MATCTHTAGQCNHLVCPRVEARTAKPSPKLTAAGEQPERITVNREAWEQALDLLRRWTRTVHVDAIEEETRDFLVKATGVPK